MLSHYMFSNYGSWRLPLLFVSLSLSLPPPGPLLLSPGLLPLSRVEWLFALSSISWVCVTFMYLLVVEWSGIAVLSVSFSCFLMVHFALSSPVLISLALLDEMWLFLFFLFCFSFYFYTRKVLEIAFTKNKSRLESCIIFGGFLN